MKFFGSQRLRARCVTSAAHVRPRIARYKS